MGNPHKGEVAFTADGNDYKLSYSANALCEMEEVLGGDPEEIFVEITKGVRKDKLRTIRIIFWQGLRDHHPDITLDDAKVILRDVSPAQLGDLVGRAFMLAMPSANEGGAVPADPQAPGGPADGTGPASSKDGSPPDSTKPYFGG